MSTPPPTYENYPPAWDAGVRSAGGEGSEHPLPPPVVLPSAPPPPPGHDRRGVLTLIGGAVAALVAIPMIASSQIRGPIADPEGWESAEASDPEDDPDGRAENETDVGDYLVWWPDGWSVDGRTDTQVVLVRGDATVIFRAYTAGDDATATEEAQRLLSRHTAGLGKRRTGAVEKGSERASIEASGTRGDGSRVDTTVHVVIDGDDRDALAVIALMPSGTPAAHRKEIARMRRDFLKQLS